MTYTVAALGGLVSGGSLLAQQVTDAGPDFAGIALLITAISGLVATVGALVLSLRKRPSVSDEVLLKLLERNEPPAGGAP